MSIWNYKAKQLLKSELVKKGISNLQLSNLLRKENIHETKSSIDCKISRGTFSASFLLQCLTVVGCKKIEIDEIHTSNLKVAENQPVYYVKNYEKEEN